MIIDADKGVSQAEALSDARRPGSLRPARLIVVAWGEAYVKTLLNLTLPAALAPGNYPYLAQHTKCELAIVAERRHFGMIERSPTFARFQKYGATHLIPIDDLVVPHSYGLTLTLAMRRGFADLGVAATETNLLFLNADFILADGSYRALVDRLISGERLIAAPSYCAIAEHVLPKLTKRCVEGGGVLALSKREMASELLRNLHTTVRGQFIDAPFHFEHVYIYQFYSQPNPHTLLGYQMPIAIVAMRPIVVPSELDTFWDWGIAAELCPGLDYSVIGDSDDFLILELRKEEEGKELLRFGPNDPAKIARLLTPLLTHDQRRCAQYPLTLHDRDLPENVESLRSETAKFRDRVLSLLPAESAPHKNRPQWIYHHLRLEQERSYLKSAPLGELPPENVNDLMRAYRHALVDELYRQHADEFLALLRKQGDPLDPECSWDMRSLVEQVRDLAIVHNIRLERMHTAQQVVDEICARVERSSRPEETIKARPTSVLAETAPLPPFARRSFKERFRAFAIAVVFGIIGRSPFVRRVHPYWAVLRGPRGIIERELNVPRRTLILSDGESGLVRLVKTRSSAAFQISPAAVRGQPISAMENFEFCYYETTIEGLRDLPAICRHASEVMTSTGRMLVCASNYAGHRLPSEGDLVSWVAVPSARFKISILNHAGVGLVTRWYHRALGYLGSPKIFGILKPLTIMAALLPIALFVNGSRVAAIYGSTIRSLRPVQVLIEIEFA
jgi:hypothetical protein